MGCRCRWPGGAQCLCFAFAGDEHPHFAGSGQGGVTQRDAARRRLGACHRSIHRLRLHRLSVAGEERCHVGVLAHAEEHQVDRRLAIRLAVGELLQLIGCELDRLGFAPLGLHTVHLVGRNPQRPEQAKVGQLEVALVVGGRHDSLVAPKEMDVVERAWPRQLHHRLVKQPRGAPPGQRDGERPARVALGQALKPLRGGVFGERGFIGESRAAAHPLDGFGLCHLWLSCSSRLSAATGPHVPAA